MCSVKGKIRLCGPLEGCMNVNRVQNWEKHRRDSPEKQHLHTSFQTRVFCVAAFERESTEHSFIQGVPLLSDRHRRDVAPMLHSVLCMLCSWCRKMQRTAFVPVWCVVPDVHFGHLCLDVASQAGVVGQHFGALLILAAFGGHALSASAVGGPAPLCLVNGRPVG